MKKNSGNEYAPNFNDLGCFPNDGVRISIKDVVGTFFNQVENKVAQEVMFKDLGCSSNKEDNVAQISSGNEDYGQIYANTTLGELEQFLALPRICE